MSNCLFQIAISCNLSLNWFEIGQEKIESALFRFYLLATIMKVA